MNDRCEIRPEDAKWVQFVTLDSAQGDEADFVISDLVQTDSAGFTGDDKPICLTLTRLRQGLIIMMNPGSFIGHEREALLMAARASTL